MLSLQCPATCRWLDQFERRALLRKHITIVDANVTDSPSNYDHGRLLRHRSRAAESAPRFVLAFLGRNTVQVNQEELHEDARELPSPCLWAKQ